MNLPFLLTNIVFMDKLTEEKLSPEVLLIGYIITCLPGWLERIRFTKKCLKLLLNELFCTIFLLFLLRQVNILRMSAGCGGTRLKSQLLKGLRQGIALVHEFEIILCNVVRPASQKTKVIPPSASYPIITSNFS